MAKEYIEREVALSAIKQAFEKGEGPSLYIKRIPTADVAEVRHGRWERTGTLVGLMNFEHFYRCTACGRRGGNTKTNYCPHCGCKMDKEN